MLKLSLIALVFLLAYISIPATVWAQEDETYIGSFTRKCIGTCGCKFTIKQCDIDGCVDREEGQNCIAAPPACNKECDAEQVVSIGGGVLKTILDWDEEIVDTLERGSDTDYNKLPTEISNGNYSTGTKSGAGNSFWYWCTHSIIDSYRLAGFMGLKKFVETKNEATHHEAVVNMRKFWRDKAPKDTYIYIDYPIDAGSPKELASAIREVKPGYAMFMEMVPGEMKSKEHVGMVTEISLDKRNNGYIKTRDSNVGEKEFQYPIEDGKITGTHYPVRGFGGVYEDAVPVVPKASEKVFANLPGIYSAAAILPNGETIQVNGSTQMPAFSTIKLWVVAAVLDAVEKGEVSLTDTYTLTEDDKRYFGAYLTSATNDTFTIQDYMNYALSYSDNMATNVLINTVGGLEKVDEFIRKSGYSDTTLQRYLGSTDYTAKTDNYTSALDAATLMENLFEGRVVSARASAQLLAMLEKRSDKRADVMYIKEPGVIGKSGFGPKTRNDVGSFAAEGGRVYMSIFLTDLSSEEKGEQAIKNTAAAVANLSKE